MPAFISYSGKDQHAYKHLCCALDIAGIERWDVLSLGVGRLLAEQLQQAISNCGYCIFLATAHSLNSTWCLAELGAFWGAGKKVILFLADSEIAESDLPPQFKGVLYTRDAGKLLDTVQVIENDEEGEYKSFDADSQRHLLADGHKTGVRRVFHNRLAVDMTHDFLNSKIGSAKVVDIASLVFKVRQTRDLKKSLKNCVLNDGIVRILLSDPRPAPTSEKGISNNAVGSTEILWPLQIRQYAEGDLEINSMPSTLATTLRFLNDIREDLLVESTENLNRFEVRFLARHVMYSSMMRIDETMLLTMYCNKEQGNGSPTLRLDRAGGGKTLFKVFDEEFEHIWKKARPALGVT